MLHFCLRQTNVWHRHFVTGQIGSLSPEKSNFLRITAVDLNIVLLAPEIPQNTGSIGRMCVCIDARLHLIKPMAFSLDETHLRRAGLDYWGNVRLCIHNSWDAFMEQEQPERMMFASTKARTPYYRHCFRLGDYLIFGSETSGLPVAFYTKYADHLYCIPMPGRHARSHNLASAVAIIAYEALRQIGELSATGRTD